MIAAVLLVPSETHRAFISDGPCGSRAPVAWTPDQKQVPDGFLRTLDGVWQEATSRPISPLHIGALVLAWDGKLVNEGLDRLDWADVRVRDSTPGRVRTSNTTPSVLGLPEGLWRAWEHGWLAQDTGVGRVVLLDTEGREVVP